MKVRRMIIVFCLITLFCFTSLTIGACAETPEKIAFKGTVKYINLEGGFWGIVSEEGKNYDPINLAAKYKKDGLQVQVEAVIVNRIGTHMWGTYIEITSINKIVAL